MKKRLIIFTAEFPYGIAETFLETEIGYLAAAFDEVRIVSSSEADVQTRNIPENCTAERIDLSVRNGRKILGLFHFLGSFFLKEIGVIKKVYGMPTNMGILATMLVSYLRAKKLEAKVEEILKRKQEGDRFFFYSYWCDDIALGLSIAQTKNPEIRTFCRMHGWDVYFERSELHYLPFRHEICSGISKIYSISENAIKYAEKEWKVKADQKFILARLGVQNHLQLKRIERDHFVLLSCSSLIPVKRINLIAESLMGITTKKIHWIHIGDGPDREKIEGLTKRLPANITVEMKGHLSNPDVFNLYDAVRPDLFINVSSSEGIPVSIMEAMSFGIPVIATDVGGTSEIVNSVNGILLNENPTSSEIASAILNVMSNDDILLAMRMEAYHTWQTKFNADINHTTFVQSCSGL